MPVSSCGRMWQWYTDLPVHCLKRMRIVTVEPAGTLAEGDTVAGFEVIHFPGHAPGLIGLWRESDRVALVGDTIYVIDSARLRPLRARPRSPPRPGPGITPRRSGRC